MFQKLYEKFKLIEDLVIKYLGDSAKDVFSKIDNIMTLSKLTVLIQSSFSTFSSD